MRARREGPVVAPCFVGGSISSLGAQPAESDRFRAANPDIKLYDGTVRGYGRVEIGRETTKVTFRALDDARREDPAIRTLASYVVETGRPEVGLA